MRAIALGFLLLAGCASAVDRKCPCPLPDVTCDAAVDAAVDAAAPDLSKARAKPLSGVFVDLDEGVKNWDDALDRLVCAGIVTVIIQSVTFDPIQAQAILRAAVDRTDAKKTPVNVYVGLKYQHDFSASSSPLEEALALDRGVADEVANWPDTLQAGIAGWYIASEIHNFQIWKDKDTSEKERLRLTWKRAAELQRYLKAVTTYVRAKTSVKGKEVLISPHFNPTADGALLSPARTKELFGRVFKDSGVTVALLQDGFGARNKPERIGCCRWSPAAFEAQAYAYEQAVRDGLAGTGTKFGVNVESFAFDADKCKTTAADPVQFERQRKIVPDEAVMVATFSLRTLRELWEPYTSSINVSCKAP